VFFLRSEASERVNLRASERVNLRTSERVNLRASERVNLSQTWFGEVCEERDADRRVGVRHIPLHNRTRLGRAYNPGYLNPGYLKVNVVKIFKFVPFLLGIVDFGLA